MSSDTDPTVRDLADSDRTRARLAETIRPPDVDPVVADILVLQLAALAPADTLTGDGFHQGLYVGFAGTARSQFPALSRRLTEVLPTTVSVVDGAQDGELTAILGDLDESATESRTDPDDGDEGSPQLTVIEQPDAIPDRIQERLGRALQTRAHPTKGFSSDARTALPGSVALLVCRDILADWRTPSNPIVAPSLVPMVAQGLDLVLRVGDEAHSIVSEIDDSILGTSASAEPVSPELFVAYFDDIWKRDIRVPPPAKGAIQTYLTHWDVEPAETTPLDEADRPSDPVRDRLYTPPRSRVVGRLCRLATALTRLDRRDAVTKEDVHEAIDILEQSYTGRAISPATRDYWLEHRDDPARVFESDRRLVIWLLESLADADGRVSHDTVVDAGREYGLTAERIEEILEGLREDAWLYEPDTGVYSTDLLYD